MVSLFVIHLDGAFNSHRCNLNLTVTFQFSKFLVKMKLRGNKVEYNRHERRRFTDPDFINKLKVAVWSVPRDILTNAR